MHKLLLHLVKIDVLKKGMYREGRKLQVHDSRLVYRHQYTKISREFPVNGMTKYAQRIGRTVLFVHYEVRSYICYFKRRNKSVMVI